MTRPDGVESELGRRGHCSMCGLDHGVPEALAYITRLEAVVEAARRVVGYGPDNVGRYGLGSWDEMRAALAALDAGGES